MKSNAARAAIGLVAIAIAIVLFVVLQDDGTESKQEASKPAAGEAMGGSANQSEAERTRGVIIIRKGKSIGGVKEFSFEQGGQIRFVVNSDVGDEIHVHGYDISKPIEPYDTVHFNFPAEIEGLFEVELEERGVPIAELKVEP